MWIILSSSLFYLADPRKQVEATTIPIESRIDDTLADPREQVEATTASLKFESRRAPADPRKQVENHTFN